MAIQTQGFQVRNMPTYVAPNPSLVAFNPVAVSDGMGQAFQLARQYEALKASRALQAEQEATRQGRISATNSLAGLDVARSGSEIGLMGDSDASKRATYQANAMVAPRQAQYDLAKMDAQIPTFKPMADKIISDANYTIAGNTARQPIIPDVVRAEATNARASTARDQNAIDLSADSLATERSRLGAAKINADLSTILAPMEAQNKAFTYGDMMANAQADANRGRTAKDTSILEAQSRIINNVNHAAAYGQPKVVDPVVTLGRFQTMHTQVFNEQQKLLNTPVPNPAGEGKIPLATYISITRDADNKIAQERGGFLWQKKSNVPTNKVGEDLLAQLQEKEQQLKTIEAQGNQISSQLFGGKGPVAAPVGPDVSKIPPAHVKALIANPDKARDFDAMYGEGAAAQILK